MNLYTKQKQTHGHRKQTLVFFFSVDSLLSMGRSSERLSKPSTHPHVTADAQKEQGFRSQECSQPWNERWCRNENLQWSLSEDILQLPHLRLSHHLVPCLTPSLHPSHLLINLFSVIEPQHSIIQTTFSLKLVFKKHFQIPQYLSYWIIYQCIYHLPCLQNWYLRTLQIFF